MLAIGTIAIVGAALLQVGYAEARRFGGGASFGYHRTVPQAPAASYSPQRTLNTPGAAAPRRGLLGAIAGLAVGGLIGTLLFGSAFHGINLFDVLVIGGILLVVLALVRHKAGSMIYAGHHFSSTPMANGYGTASPHPSDADRSSAPVIDRDWFLDSAKQIFVRMQAAWDAKDITEIRRFCTPEIVSHIEADMATLGEGRALTEVATLDAGIAEAWHESGYAWAAVNFRAMLREQSLDASGALTGDIRNEINEIWIFRHDPRTGDPTWFLAGIQQAG
ncbi:MAG TPA: TIM44-like domain-containing protein [Mariprofundaceae bacterium]|nr:TIM44-like domain-containing protein [Mariprofundaceae bacterium]